MSGNLNSTEEHIHKGNLGLWRVEGQAQRQGIYQQMGVTAGFRTTE